MEPEQPVEQPTQLQSTPPQLITHPDSGVPQLPKSPKLLTNILVIISLLSLSGLIYFYIQIQSLKKQLALQPSPTPITSDTSSAIPSPTSDPTIYWTTYQINELGISFRYPPILQPMDFPKGIEINGETGKQLCLSFIPSTTSFKLIKPTHAGGGSCLAVFAIGSTSTDYQAGREGGFGDIQGYEKSNTEYKANFVLGKQYDIPSNLVDEITNSNGVIILKIKGQNATQFSERGPEPIPGTPGDGYLGALINVDHPPYRGFNIQMKVSDKLTSQIFDQILSTVKFIDPQ